MMTFVQKKTQNFMMMKKKLFDTDQNKFFHSISYSLKKLNLRYTNCSE